MTVEAILAIDKNNGLAKNGAIPWHSKFDLNFFKQKTINNIVVMGSKTFLSLPNSLPLKSRQNIVVTNNSTFFSSKYSHFSSSELMFVSMNECIDLITNNTFQDKTIFIIGGKQLFTQLYKYCSTIWITQLKKDYECDLSLDTFDKKEAIIVYDDDELTLYKLTSII